MYIICPALYEKVITIGEASVIFILSADQSTRFATPKLYQNSKELYQTRDLYKAFKVMGHTSQAEVCLQKLKGYHPHT